MQFLINAPNAGGKVAKRAKRKAGSRRRRTAAQRAATARMLAANAARRRTSTSKGGGMAAKRKRRKAKAAAPRRRRRRSTRRNPGVLANPRRRRSTARKATRRRRSYRRNPSFSLGGTVRTITRGVRDAAVLTAGEMGCNIIANQIPVILKDDPEMDANLRKVIGAAGVGMLASMLFKGKPDIARFAVAGALSGPIKGYVKNMLPTTGPLAGALSAYPFTTGYMAAYPQQTFLPRLQGYPRGLGCADEQTQATQVFQTGAY